MSPKRCATLAQRAAGAGARDRCRDRIYVGAQRAVSLRDADRSSSPRFPGSRLMDTVADRLFGFAAGDLLGLFTIVSLAASISAMVLAGPRVYFAMARDGMFVRAAGRVHPRFHTPATAIVAQGVWSSVLVLSGTLAQLVDYTGFAVVLFSGITVSALFVLRRRDPARRVRSRRSAIPGPRRSSCCERAHGAHAIWRTVVDVRGSAGRPAGRRRAYRPACRSTINSQVQAARSGLRSCAWELRSRS